MHNWSALFGAGHSRKAFDLECFLLRGGGDVAREQPLMDKNRNCEVQTVHRDRESDRGKELRPKDVMEALRTRRQCQQGYDLELMKTACSAMADRRWGFVERKGMSRSGDLRGRHTEKWHWVHGLRRPTPIGSQLSLGQVER